MMWNLRLMLRVLIISLFLFACARESAEKKIPEEYYKNLQAGKEFLAKGEEIEAGEYFEKALSFYADGTEAKYGLVISKGLKAFNMLGMISSLPFWFSPGFSPSESENEVLENMLIKIFSGIGELH